MRRTGWLNLALALIAVAHTAAIAPHLVHHLFDRDSGRDAFSAACALRTASEHHVAVLHADVAPAVVPAVASFVPPATRPAVEPLVRDAARTRAPPSAVLPA